MTAQFQFIFTSLATLDAGSTRDYIIIGSDSGRIDIVQYDDAKNKFQKIHEETFGRSGCRRIIVRSIHSDLSFTCSSVVADLVLRIAPLTRLASIFSTPLAAGSIRGHGPARTRMHDCRD